MPDFEIIESFIHSRKLSLLTKNKYKSVISEFLNFSNGYISKRTLRNYIIFLSMERGLKNISTNNKITILRIFLRYATENGNSYLRPIKDIKNLKEPKKVMPYLTINQMNHLYKNFIIGVNITFQDFMLIDVLYGTGIREQELAKIKIIDLDADYLSVVIRNGKGGKQRIVAIPIKTSIMLKQFIEFNKTLYPDCQLLFPGPRGKGLSHSTIYRHVSKILGQFDNTKLGAHRLRHTFASVLINNGAPIKAIQKQLGHWSVVETMKYTHLNIKGLIKIHRKAHPLNKKL